jgi:hypothetical protein
MEWSCIISAYLRMVEKFREEIEDLEDCAWNFKGRHPRCVTIKMDNIVYNQ